MAQVTYSARVARFLHTLPLAMAPMLLLRGRRRGRLGRLGEHALHAALHLAGLAGAVVWPALLGAALVTVTGTSPFVLLLSPHSSKQTTWLAWRERPTVAMSSQDGLSLACSVGWLLSRRLAQDNITRLFQVNQGRLPL